MPKGKFRKQLDRITGRTPRGSAYTLRGADAIKTSGIVYPIYRKKKAAKVNRKKKRITKKHQRRSSRASRIRS